MDTFLKSREVLGISGLQRRAFIVTVPKVTSFAKGEGTTGRSYPLLDGIEEPAGDLVSALEKFDYRVDHYIPETDDELENAFDDILKGIRRTPGPCLVHVIGHGDVVNGYLHLMPPSGKTTMFPTLKTLVGECHRSAAPDNYKPRMLILDLCSAASAVKGLLIEEYDDTWVAVAAADDEGTYNGVFTSAVARALRRAAEDPQQKFGDGEFIDMFDLSVEISSELKTLRSTSPGPATRPRFLGRWYERGINDQLFPRRPVAGVIQGLALGEDRPANPQLQSLIDIRYFLSRAGHHFTGRHSILRKLGTWAHQSISENSFHLISGGPGSGKSSIIAALTLAWHHQILNSNDHAEDSRRLRHRLPTECQSIPEAPVAAIDASQKRTTDLIPVLANQIAAQTGIDAPTSDDPGDFEEWIQALPQPPLIIIDSIDQAVNSDGMTKILLRPLAETRHNGLPICRMLLGTRNNSSRYDALLSRLSPVVHNLNDIDSAELQSDLHQFFTERLPVTETAVDTAGLLAEDLASRTGPVDCGAFLVAALYATHLAQRGIPADENQLRQQLPRTMVQLFEMQSRTGDNSDQALQRQKVLKALAHAKGDGMPASVANHLAHTVYGATEKNALPTILSNDEDIKLYLRYNVDSDGKPLYSLFHQSLAEHLRREDPQPSPLGSTGLTHTLLTLVTNWADASPYLKRHLADHAADENQISHLITQPNYLAHAHPHRILPLLREPVARESAMFASAYRAGAAYLREETSATRRAPRVALDQIRAGLGRGLATRNPTTWWPRWTKGHGLHPALLDTYLMLGDSVVTMKTLRRSGRTVILALTDRGVIYIWDWRSGKRQRRVELDIPTPVTSAHILDHSQHRILTIATSAGALHVANLLTNGEIDLETIASDIHVRALTTLVHDDQLVTAVAAETGIQLWEPSTKTRISKQPVGLVEQRTMTAITHTHHDGSNFLLASDTEGDIWKWDLDFPATAVSRWRRPDTHPQAIASQNQGAHDLTVTGSSDGIVRIGETRSLNPLITEASGPSSPISAVAIGDSTSQPLLAAADCDDLIWLWGHDDVSNPRDIYYGHNDRINELEFTNVNGRHVLNSGSSDGTVRAWDLSAGATAPKIKPLSSKVTDVATGNAHGQPLVVTATDRSDIYLRNLTDGAPVRPFQVPRLGMVRAMSVASAEEELFLLTAGDDRAVRLWDLGQLTDQRDEAVHIEPCFVSNDHHSGIIRSDVTHVDDVPIACTMGDNGETLLWNVRERCRYSDNIRRNITKVSPQLTAMKLLSWQGQLFLVTGDANGICRVLTFAPHGFDEKWRIQLPSAVTALALSEIAGTPIIGCGSDDKTVQLWNPVESSLKSMEGHDGHITCITSGTWGKRPVFASGDDEGQVRIWDGLTGQRYDTIRLPLSVSSLAFGLDNELVIGAGREVIAIDLRTDWE